MLFIIMIERVCPIHEVPFVGDKCPQKDCSSRPVVTTTVYWCSVHKIPLYNSVCPLCGEKASYLATDIRPVFPEEKLLLAILTKQDSPLSFDNKSIWCSNSGYYVDGNRINLSIKKLNAMPLESILETKSIFDKYRAKINEDYSDRVFTDFVKANVDRYNEISDEAISYVILFSIGFGPDENGKVYYNFGPLNQEGGWKRLNVAISRSRREMIVFASMTSDMIDVNRSSNDGVNQLHDFLKYAETGILGDDISKENFHAKGITLQICKALETAGYKTQKNVGSSDLKIDIAVVNPYDENEYLLGVMLDGDSYRKAENTKDRELSQQSVLEGLGWSTYRIWTMDWWDNKDKEIKKLIAYVEECRVKAEEKAANPETKDSGPESEELIPREVKEEKKERKKKDKGSMNSSFETKDRFTVDTGSEN